MVHRLILAYRGTDYAGWQRQANARSVQQTVEEALADLLGEAVRLHAAGRTDAGVHARGQVADLELPRPFPCRGLVHGTNHRLPADVRVLAADPMPDGFSARRHAAAKTYLYRLHRLRLAPVPLPQEAPYVAPVPDRIDLPRLRRASALLVGRHDFAAFALPGGGPTTTVRRLFAVDVDEAGPELRLRFTGDGFLRGMVRSLVGTLVEVGAGRREPESLAALLAGGRRQEAGFTAPARGLELERIAYPPRWRPPC